MQTLGYLRMKELDLVGAERDGFLACMKWIKESNTGRFSFEDMRKCYEAGQVSITGNMEDGKTIDKDERIEFSQFIQSLTPQPKGEIVIECEMEENRYFAQDGELYKIKLNKDGQPIIYFK